MANAILNKRNNEPGFITLLIEPPFLRGLFFCNLNCCGCSSRAFLINLKVYWKYILHKYFNCFLSDCFVVFYMVGVLL